MTIHFDVTKLVEEPRRSGIQRVERALIRHWPGDPPLVLCRFAENRLHALPDAVRAILCADAPPGGLEAERALLAPHLARPGAVIARGARLLCAELFDDPARAAYHREEAAHAAWLVYDFLPFLHPEWFPAGPANRLMPFLHALRAVPNRAYISAATKRDAAERILRRPADGPVLPLGADGLGLEPQSFAAGRRDIVMLGTIEARKNVAPAIEAFRLLWAEGLDLRLVLLGAVEPDALREQALLREFAGDARLVAAGSVPDAAVRDALRGARALLFPSEGEGYGLPPMEALYCGVPAIISAGLPALEALPSFGQIRLPRADAGSIAAALRTLRDDAVAAGLWANAAQLQLPTWRDFAVSVADWLSAGLSD